MRALRNIAILTSGGDAPGMNACTRAIVRTGIASGYRMFGVEYAYQGLVDGKFQSLGSRDVGNIISQGGTTLGAGRSTAFKTPEGLARALEMIRATEIDALIIQGGDGSLRGAQALSEAGVSVIGIPASIDNDVSGTSYSIGFDTALNTVLDAIRRLRDTARSHNRIVIVEVMGRACGEIALRAGVAGGAEVILVPEHPTDLPAVAAQLLDGRRRGKRFSIVVLAEGAGHAYDVQAKLEAVDVELKSTVTVLGHIQRGGDPTAFDIIVASEMGYRAVKALQQGQRNVMVSYSKGDYSLVPIPEVNEGSKRFDEELFDLSQILAR
ncbi:MAG: ATP-dependent 6-phosphofructokinase [bacterium]